MWTYRPRNTVCYSVSGISFRHHSNVRAFPWSSSETVHLVQVKQIDIFSRCRVDMRIVQPVASLRFLYPLRPSHRINVPGANCSLKTSTSSSFDGTALLIVPETVLWHSAYEGAYGNWRGYASLWNSLKRRFRLVPWHPMMVGKVNESYRGIVSTLAESIWIQAREYLS